METIRYLLKFLFKLAIALAVASLVWWLVTALYPSLSIRAMFFSKDDGDWLPPPGSVGSLLGTHKVPDQQTNVYTPGPVYDGYGNAYNGNSGGSEVNFVTYTTEGIEVRHNGQLVTSQNTTTGTQVTNTNTQNPSTNNGYQTRASYIRNLSIYQGGHVYTGLSFVGEAQNTMFKDGKFPIIIVDSAGRVATVAIAEATTNWSVPGWTRFQVRVSGVLPANSSCTMVFQSGNVTSISSAPVRVSIPVMCN